MTTQPQQPHTNHSVVAWLFVLYVLFVVYGSLVPLHYVDRSWDNAIHAFKSIPFLNLGIGSRADWVANLLLFMPMTFLAGMLFAANGTSGKCFWVSCLIAMAAILLAICIEFTQLFFPQRTVSQNDIFAEILGGLSGLGLFWLFGNRFHLWLDSLWHTQQQKDRLDRLLVAYLILLFVFNVLPLDLTLSPVELFHKWKEGRIVLMPFAGLKGGLFNGLYEVATDILIWLPAGTLWALRTPNTAGRIVKLGLLAAFVIEFLQLFVYSRVTDATDVCLAGLGAWMGWVVVQRTAGVLPAVIRLLEHRWLALWLGWVALTLGIFWFPFDFSLDDFTVTAAGTAFSRLPFTTYYFVSEYHAINEVLRKLGFFLPGGLILGFGTFRLRRSAHQIIYWPLALVVLFAFCVEAGQLALPGKVADLTDALLESTGGFIGYLMACWVSAAATTPSCESTPKPVAQGPILTSGQKRRRAWTRRSRDFMVHVAYVLGLSVLVGLLLRVPGLPYNIAELLAPGAGAVVSVLALALIVYGMAVGPFLLFPMSRRKWLLGFPVGLTLHGLAAWGLLRIGVPLESLEDIVGSPVLGWPWEWEMMGRYVALHMSVMLQVLGAALCVRAILMPATILDFVYWSLSSAFLAWPLYQLVVKWAATDNLTELIADHASFIATSCLAFALFLTCLTASAISAALAVGRDHARLYAFALIAAIGAALFYWLGAEQTIVKYGNVFSAFQFLVSPDRDHYLVGFDLLLRCVLVFIALCGGLVANQWVAWRSYWLAYQTSASRILPSSFSS